MSAQLVKMKRKAEGLPINVMIIALLGLAVFFVLLVIFGSSSASFTKTVLSCDAKGGDCIEKEFCQYEKTNFRCPQKEQVCCINPLGR